MVTESVHERNCLFPLFLYNPYRSVHWNTLNSIIRALDQKEPFDYETAKQIQKASKKANLVVACLFFFLVLFLFFFFHATSIVIKIEYSRHNMQLKVLL